MLHEPVATDKSLRSVVGACRRHASVLVALAVGLLAIPLSGWLTHRKPHMVDRPQSASVVADFSLPSSRAREPIHPITAFTSLDPKIVALGERLFFDKRLSGDGTISCASCHVIAEGGDDGRRFSVGVQGQVGDINAPTVLNSAHNFRQFWNGRAASLEEQVQGPIHNPIEMNSDWGHVLTALLSDPTYVANFREAFDAVITESRISEAIATYERSLTTPDSAFDRWLLGDDSALNDKQLQGYHLFVEYQCTNCHHGSNVGGNMFEKLGLMEEYFSQSREPLSSDLGRYAVTHEEQDRFVFRVPPLRNVALTAPYFHDGSAQTLADAVRTMIVHQLGRPVVETDVRLIEEFLHTLTGTLPEVNQ